MPKVFSEPEFSVQVKKDKKTTKKDTTYVKHCSDKPFPHLDGMQSPLLQFSAEQKASADAAEITIVEHGVRYGENATVPSRDKR